MCVYVIYSYVVCIPWNAREIYNSCVHIYIYTFISICLCISVCMCICYIYM